MRRVVFALTVLGMAQGAVAQRRVESDTGSHIPIPKRARIPEALDASKAESARVALAEFARCTVDRKAADVAKMLTIAANRLDDKVWTRLADDQCLDSGMMKFRSILLRGALFVELEHRRYDFKQRGKQWMLPVVPINDSLTIAPQDPDPTSTALLSFATCVVDHAPDKAEAVLRTPTASTAQNAAFTALNPELGTCLPQGATVKLSKSILEGALAEATYRGHIPAQPATEAK